MKLADFLSAKEMSPTAFARDLKVAPSTVFRWINGDRKPELSMMLLISKKTSGKVKIADFLAEEESAA